MAVPVLVSVYNREQHLKDCVLSLQSNDLAKETTLYIVSDAANRSEDVEIVARIREYIKGIDQFKKVIPIIRDNNMGSYASVKQAIDEIITEHGKIIFLEDDIRVSKKFLQFMNESLAFYQDDSRIFSISSYSLPDFDVSNVYNDDLYIWGRYSPWGVGMWADRWHSVDWDMKNYQSFSQDKSLVRKFKDINPETYCILMDQVKGKINALDLKICLDMFMKNMYSIYPVHTICLNKGHDGSGEHGGCVDKFYNQHMLDDWYPNLSSSLEESKEVNKMLYDYHFSFYRQNVIPFLDKMGIGDFLRRLKKGKFLSK